MAMSPSQRRAHLDRLNANTAAMQACKAKRARAKFNQDHKAKASSLIDAAAPFMDPGATGALRALFGPRGGK